MKEYPQTATSAYKCLNLRWLCRLIRCHLKLKVRSFTAQYLLSFALLDKLISEQGLNFGFIGLNYSVNVATTSNYEENENKYGMCKPPEIVLKEGRLPQIGFHNRIL